MQEIRTKSQWFQDKISRLQHRKPSTTTHQKWYRTGMEIRLSVSRTWVDSSKKDIATRKALAWQTLNRMTRIWTSSTKPELKKRFFLATVISILLYGCEAWTMTEAMEKSLNGTYTRMLRKALNVHWSSHTTNGELYGKLPAVCDKIASRRLQLAGHCYRHPELSTQKLILWEPKQGQRGRGRLRTSYVDTLKRDTGAHDVCELATMMADRDVWRTHVRARLRTT